MSLLSVNAAAANRLAKRLQDNAIHPWSPRDTVVKTNQMEG